MAVGGIHCLDKADANTARTKRADNQVVWSPMAQLLVCNARAVQSGTWHLQLCVASYKRPPTGKPDAGNPLVRFGGRGGAQPSIPTPIPERIPNVRGSHRLPS